MTDRFKWLYDEDTGIYHNVSFYMELRVESVETFKDEVVYNIVGVRADGKMGQISTRVDDPKILHDRILRAVGEIA